MDTFIELTLAFTNGNRLVHVNTALIEGITKYTSEGHASTNLCMNSKEIIHVEEDVTYIIDQIERVGQ